MDASAETPSGTDTDTVVPGPRPAARPVDGPMAAPEVTYTECRRCGTLIAGLDGRYACAGCGWVNDHSEGHRALPTAEDDPDYPGAVAPRRGTRRGRARGEGHRCPEPEARAD
ncbi:hypothetical protein ACFYPN_00835 [Streptomyces sp. NPDC005576]|uniref:hypothetical protein n=1 Tax=Streptomyces sp. NPDC005576 TaxID=3364726 RepID=UPI0036B02636